VTWAANVLGVAVSAGPAGVTLDWQRPVNSSHVVVLRALGNRKRGIVVYRGRATHYRDSSTSRCTVYRYTIVNYDLRDRPSTGVPTAVVTGNCG
jgi:hypothetical protein